MKTNWLAREPCLPLPYYALVTSQKELDYNLGKLKITEHTPFLPNAHSHAATHILRNPKGECVCLVAMPLGEIKKKQLFYVLGLMVHEAMHVWQEYMENIGEESPSSEFGAYAIQRIAQSLIVEVLRIRGTK